MHFLGSKIASSAPSALLPQQTKGNQALQKVERLNTRKMEFAAYVLVLDKTLSVAESVLRQPAREAFPPAAGMVRE